MQSVRLGGGTLSLGLPNRRFIFAVCLLLDLGLLENQANDDDTLSAPSEAD